MTNGSLMRVASIAECSPWSIQQYFWPVLSDYLSRKPFICCSEWPFYTGFTVPHYTNKIKRKSYSAASDMKKQQRYAYMVYNG